MDKKRRRRKNGNRTIVINVFCSNKIVFLSHQVGSFLGAFLGGYFYDLYGSYDYAWYLAIALSGFAALVHLPIDERPIIRSPITS